MSFVCLPSSGPPVQPSLEPRRSLQRARAVALLLGLFITSAGFGSTFVMPTDEQLLDRSAVVVVAKVVARETAPDAGLPATDYWVEIERPVKGFVPGSTMVVRVLGGVRADGLAMRLSGAPSLSNDSRVVLFLEPHDSGTYRIMDLALGAFEEIIADGVSYAVRDLEGSSEINLFGDPRSAQRAQAHQPRRFEAFVDWLVDYSEGRSRAKDYFVTPGAVVGLRADFRTTKSPSDPPPTGCGPKGGNHVRWTQWDRGEDVVFFAHEGGQAGVPSGGFDELEDAMAAWNNDPGSSVRLKLGGTTDRTLGDFDGTNTIIFEDLGDQIAGNFNGAGVVAIATVFFDCDVLHTFPLGVAHDIVEADIITQDGVGSFFFSLAADPAIPFSEITGHELGHTCGLSHSCGDMGIACSGDAGDALMRAFVHNDGRGAAVGVDDIAGIGFLYGPAASDGTPPAPSNLVATASGVDSIDLGWTDNSAGEDAFDIEMMSTFGNYQLATTVTANVTQASIGGFDEASYWTFRVRARNSAGGSASSNEASTTTMATPSPCQATDQAMCLADDRFEVSARWATVVDTSGDGIGTEITDNTATFWFFNPENVELVVKVLDACDPFSTFWVFAGGLTNVLTELTVVDTQSGQANTWVNPQLTTFEPIQDTKAFFTCP